MSEPMRTLDASELELLATGAWILGAGGGGNPYHAYLNMRERYRGGTKVRLMDPMSLEDDAWVACVSNMGAPLVGEERLGAPETAAAPVRMMEEFLGERFAGIMSLEIGGSNALQPLLAASVMDLPVVDADCMGRAFPEAQMTSFAIGDLRCYPFCLADIRDNTVIIPRAASWKWMERISRKVCTEVGSIAATCKAPRTGAEVKEWAIHGTTTQAIAIGRAVHDARSEHRDPVDAVLEATGGSSLFRGKIVDVQRTTTEGFLRGAAEVDGLGEDRGARCRLEFQNEFAVAYRDGKLVAMVPEILCVVDAHSGEAVGTETLRYGQRVRVIVLPAPEILRTPKGLEHVGPRAFGYDVDFVSVFGEG